MSQSRKNLLVGFTVLGALLAFGWMMLRFGSAPAKLFRNGPQLMVHLSGDRADGLAEGSQVLYRGVSVGQITHLRRDENQRDVIIDANIDDTPPLPANVEGVIRTQSLISGQAVLSLELLPADTTQPAIPQGTLANNQMLTARFVGSDLIPQQFGELASELEKTTRDVREAKLITHLDETVRSAGDVMKSLQDYVNDPKMKDDLRVSLANFRQTTETANRAAVNLEKFSGNLQTISDQATDTLATARQTLGKSQADIDQLTNQFNDRLLQISKLLDGLQATVTKVNSGQGTAGALLNDPKLYQSLLDNSKELTATLADLHRLVDQWEQEGISFKLH